MWRQEDFPAAFARAEVVGKLAVIELQLAPAILSTSMTVDETRAAGAG